MLAALPEEEYTRVVDSVCSEQELSPAWDRVLGTTGFCINPGEMNDSPDMEYCHALQLSNEDEVREIARELIKEKQR